MDIQPKYLLAECMSTATEEVRVRKEAVAASKQAQVSHNGQNSSHNLASCNIQCVVVNY